jgi:hypothetical protein
MRLSCQKILLVLAPLTLSCGDPTSPRPPHDFYVLASVNGQPLPAILSPIPEATTTVLWATLAFQGDEDVIWLEHRREVSNNVPRENTYRTEMRYRRNGNAVKIGLFDLCPPNVACATFDGVFVGSELRLTVGWFSPTTPIVYTYQPGVILN